MDNTKDRYKTIARPSKAVLYKQKKSKFIGYAFPVQDPSEVKPLIAHIRKQHPTAGHVCFAWQIGVDRTRFRTNDDGEPNHSAGMPIYGQLQSFGLTNILVAVARIFGGTKLGVGGLISAYRTTARMTLEESKVVVNIQQVEFELRFEYAIMNKVMHLIKQHALEIVSQHMDTSCALVVAIRKSREETVEKIFDNLAHIQIEKRGQ